MQFLTGRHASPTLRVELTGDANYSPTHIPVDLVFDNSGPEPVRLLNQFEPLPVFFSFRLTRPDGTPVAVAGGGKADFPTGALECVELRTGETVRTSVNLASTVASHTRLEPGRYALSATYHNQYGEDCFKGSVESEPVELVLQEGAPGT